MTDVPCVLGVDPGVHSAVAVVSLARDPILLDIVELCYSHKRRTNSASSLVAGLVERYTPIMACVEDQYVGSNPHSSLALAQTCGRWLEACEVADLDCVLVKPSAWQAAELGSRAHDSRDTRKAAAASRALGLWRVQLSEHCADAALIARWAAIERIGGRL